MTASLVTTLWPQLAADVAGHEARCPGAAPNVVRVRVVGWRV